MDEARRQPWQDIDLARTHAFAHLRRAAVSQRLVLVCSFPRAFLTHAHAQTHTDTHRRTRTRAHKPTRTWRTSTRSSRAPCASSQPSPESSSAVRRTSLLKPQLVLRVWEWRWR